MKKISTLFKKDPNNLALVIDEINEDNDWVVRGEGTPTQKFDGSACAIIDGSLYKRYDAKKGKQVPLGAIPCQEPDLITGHHPHWVKCDIHNPSDRYFIQAFDRLKNKVDGTYELCGEKVQGNPENIATHELIKHGSRLIAVSDYSFLGIKQLLTILDVEGIVFHHPDGRMCKIRKSDFGIKR